MTSERIKFLYFRSEDLYAMTFLTARAAVDIQSREEKKYMAFRTSPSGIPSSAPEERKMGEVR